MFGRQITPKKVKIVGGPLLKGAKLFLPGIFILSIYTFWNFFLLFYVQTPCAMKGDSRPKR